ncbi:MAG: saccharopine dehydrogenase C-terminal domain-containing protein, partial [Planctomycetota bacterium]
QWPYQYKAPFAPSDVIEEYPRPARIVENGKIVVKPALSDPELMDFPQVGTLEAFNTDGLRTLLGTVRVANMREKTLRYPGHIELMRVLRETGFFDQSEIEVKGVKVRPRDVTAKLLFPRWTYEQGEEEFTVLRVLVEGLHGGKAMRYAYDLYDEYDRTSGMSSMARTTSFPCVIVARMLALGRFAERGVFAPETLAQREGLFELIVSELDRRGVKVRMNVQELARSS